MAKQILENPQYAGYKKHLVIISDMENDFPPAFIVIIMSLLQDGMVFIKFNKCHF